MELQRCLSAAAAVGASRSRWRCEPASFSIADDLGTAICGERLQKDGYNCLVWAMSAECWFRSFVEEGGVLQSFGQYLAGVSVGRDEARVAFVNQRRAKFKQLLLGYDARITGPRAGPARLFAVPGQLPRGQSDGQAIDLELAVIQRGDATTRVRSAVGPVSVCAACVVG